MIRLIGAALIIAASASAGAYMNMRLYKRRDNLSAVIAALEYLKTHICFSDMKLEKALRLSGAAAGNIAVFSDAADAIGDGINAAWRNAVYKNKEKMFFKDSDAASLASLGERLGITDADDQRKNIDGVIAALTRLRAEARDDYEKNGRVYRGCGILCGVLAALLLI